MKSCENPGRTENLMMGKQKQEKEEEINEWKSTLNQKYFIIRMRRETV